jgi:hypothetical protein
MASVGELGWTELLSAEENEVGDGRNRLRKILCGNEETIREKRIGSQAL